MAGLVHTVARSARRPHLCSRCGNGIRRGERYLSHTASPGGELGYTGWARLAECASCAETYGRPIPAKAGVR